MGNGKSQSPTTSSSQRGLRSIFEMSEIKMDYMLLLQHVLRAIRSPKVRAGILPPQSGLRRDDGKEFHIYRQIRYRAKSAFPANCSPFFR